VGRLKKLGIGFAACLIAALFARKASAQTTAHVSGSVSGHRPSGAHARIYDVRFEAMNYEALHNGANCKLPTGADYPAQIIGKNLVLTVNNKVYKLEIIGSHE
jgi:hypothetical protein